MQSAIQKLLNGKTDAQFKKQCVLTPFDKSYDANRTPI